MLLKRFITIALLLALSSSAVMPLAAFAEDGEDTAAQAQADADAAAAAQAQADADAAAAAQAQADADAAADAAAAAAAESDVVVEVVSDEAQDAVDAVADYAGESEGEVQVTEEGTTVTSEEVDEEAFTTEMQEDLVASTEAPDQFFVAVMWGAFSDGDTDLQRSSEDTSTIASTTWDGMITIDNDAGEGVFSRPVKTLLFERDQDSLDFENMTINELPFVSTIYNHHDGVLIKVRTDLDSSDSGKISFETAFSTDVTAVYLADLVGAGSAEFTYGDYKVVMTVLSREDWINAQGSGSSSTGTRPTDAEPGAWYEGFMNYNLAHNIISGYADANGRFNGKVGPGDTLTRLQLLKIVYEISDNTCDPKTVAQDSSTDWMGDNWARGYVECTEGLGLTLLDDVIQSDLSKAQAPAFRWEVVVLACELLGLESAGAPDTTLSDVANSGLDPVFIDMIDELVDLGVISGNPDGTFRPYNTVNRAEAFKILALLDVL